VEDPDGAAKVKSAPDPLRPTVWGLLGALPETLRVPVRVPTAVGVKVAAMVQAAPAAKVLPQELVWEKSPLTVIPEIVNETVPVFVNVTLCGPLVFPDIWGVKVSDVGETLAAAPAPVPLKATVWVPPATPLWLSVIVRLPVRVPAAEGVNVKLIGHEAPGARLPGQVLV
jgi:hypothetical protein